MLQNTGDLPLVKQRNFSNRGRKKKKKTLISQFKFPGQVGEIISHF